MSENFKHNEITSLIIKAFYVVYNILGYGFLEKVYQNAMLLELRKSGLDAVSQIPLKVYYGGTEVGNYFADIIVNKCVIIELKAGEGFV
jgi:GxxExxY protein